MFMIKVINRSHIVEKTLRAPSWDVPRTHPITQHLRSQSLLLGICHACLQWECLFSTWRSETRILDLQMTSLCYNMSLQAPDKPQYNPYV